MKTNIIFILIVIALFAWIGNDHYNKKMDEQVSGDLIATCPACPTPDRSDCTITTDRIIGGTVNYADKSTATRFVLPNKSLEIKIGEEVFTRVQLDALVPAFVEPRIPLTK